MSTFTLEKSAGNPSTNSLQPSGKGVILCFHSSYNSKSHGWILDSGATNHMTPFLSLFHTYSPCTSTKRLLTANGSSAPIIGQGSVNLSADLQLSNVLYVPMLSANLLSIPQLIKDLNCHVLFSRVRWVIQEQDSGKMIGRADEHDGLFFLDTHA